MRAIRTFLFWSTSPSWLSRMICRITRGPWNHTGIGFRMDDCSEYYYEALAGKGVRGPKPMCELDAFAEKPGCVVFKDYTELSPDKSYGKMLECVEMTGRTGYAEWQLVCMWAFERFNIPVPTSPNRVVCSELTSRVLSPDIDLRDPSHTTFDTVNPSSSFRAWMRLHSSAMMDI